MDKHWGKVENARKEYREQRRINDLKDSFIYGYGRPHDHG
jgi:hypothetical protein